MKGYLFSYRKIVLDERLLIAKVYLMNVYYISIYFILQSVFLNFKGLFPNRNLS